MHARIDRRKRQSEQKLNKSLTMSPALQLTTGKRKKIWHNLLCICNGPLVGLIFVTPPIENALHPEGRVHQICKKNLSMYMSIILTSNLTPKFIASKFYLQQI
jgi:hypothetical protein